MKNASQPTDHTTLPIKKDASTLKDARVGSTTLKIAGAIAIVCLVPATPLCSILGWLLTLAPDVSYCIPYPFFCNGDVVEHASTVPQTSATILGLTNFGFLLGIRLNKTDLRAQYNFLGMAFFAICVVTVLQMTLIIQAHANTLHFPFYYYSMYTTAMALLVVGSCFVRIVIANSQTMGKDTEYNDDVETTAKSTQGPDSKG